MRLIVQFLADDEELPANYTRISNDGNWAGTQYRHALHYAWTIDILRNEKPIFAQLSKDRVSMNRLQTMNEEVGEEESTD